VSETADKRISPLAEKTLRARPDAYRRLVVHDGTPAAAHELLSGVRPEQLLAGSPAAASAMLAGLWLWHDGLHESHQISQGLHDRTGSFWHAIMHRREGDFSNAKYWYAKAAGHPAMPTLAAQAGALVSQQPADKLLLRIVARGFDPGALVDLVVEVHDKPDDSRHEIAVQLQQLEWQALFNQR
jgi:hypothetical protein